MAAKAHPLIFFVDHQPPQKVFGLQGVVAEHDKAHGGFVRIDGPEPGFFRVEVGLGDGDGVGGDEVFLGRAHIQAEGIP